MIGGVGAGPGSLVGGIVGDVFGGGIGSALGRPLGWMGDMFSRNQGTRERQGEYMHMTTGIQQSTMGHLMMNQDESGLGGRGMNMQSAGKLAQKLTGVGREQGMSREDMTNLTRSAGELNFLDNATNTDQIFETVKKLAKVIGVMGKLTGDPDIMRNLKEISNLRAVGLNISQAVQATEQIDMAARGMGMDRFQAMTSAGAAGMGMFQRGGMTGGVGLVQGVGAGAMARMGAAGLDERQLALSGGVSGLANTYMQQNMRFAQGPGNLMMMSGLTGGAGGEFGLDSGFGEGLQGKGSFSGRLQKGLSNVRTPGQLIQFLGQQRELQSETMEQLGPFGAQLSQARLIEDMAKQMGGANQRESVLMAASMITGSPEKGLELVRTLGSSQFRDRAGNFIDEERKRVRATGAQEAAQQRGADKDARKQRKRRASLGRGIMGWMGEAVGYLDEEPEGAGTIGELNEVMQDEQEEQDRLADEAFEENTGLKRTTKRAGASLIARPVERERKRAEKMMAAGWKVSGLSRSGKELGGVGVSFDYDEKTKTIKVKEGQPRAKTAWGVSESGEIEMVQVEAGLLSAEKTAADSFLGDEALSAGFFSSGVFANSKETALQRKGALVKLRRSGKRIQENSKIKEKEWRKGLKSMVDKLGAGSTAMMERAAIDYAHSLDATGDGVDTDVMFDKMIRAFAKERNISYGEASVLLKKDRDKIERWGVKFIEDSGDEAAVSALRRTKNAVALDYTKMDSEALEKFREGADEDMFTAMRELGFADADADPGDASSAQNAAFDTFRGLSPEDQGLAMGILAKEGGTADGKTSEELMRLKADNPERYKRVQEAARKMQGGLDADAREQLAQKAGDVTGLYGGTEGLTEELTKGAGTGKGRLGGMQASGRVTAIEGALKKLRDGDDFAERSGEGAGAGTEASRAKDAALAKQRGQLESLPEIFGELPGAVKELKEAAVTMKEAFDKNVQKDTPNPWFPWGYPGQS